jgi:hypothetical protein
MKDQIALERIVNPSVVNLHFVMEFVWAFGGKSGGGMSADRI